MMLSTLLALAPLLTTAQAPYMSQLPDHVNPTVVFSDAATFDPIWLTEQHLAEQFRVQPGSKFTPTKLTWWGADYKATYTGTDSFTIEILTDDGTGLPWSVLYLDTNVQPSVTVTGWSPVGQAFPWAEKRYELNLGPIAQLDPGDYHVRIYNNTTFTSDGTWGWANALDDPTNGVHGFSFSPDAGLQWIHSDQYGLAMEVTGDLVLAMSASVDSLSISSPSTQILSLDAGTSHAGELYFVLGSLSGMAPGLDFGGFHLDLNLDSYFISTLTAPNTPTLQQSFGVLDGNGQATSYLNLPSGLSPSLVGLTGAHAFMALDPTTLAPTFASNSVTVDLVP